MGRFSRATIASTLSLLTLALEGYWVWSLPIWERVTNKAVHDFLLISMGLAFIPVVLVGVAALAAFIMAMGLGLIPGVIVWKMTDPRRDTAQRSRATEPKHLAGRGGRDA